MKTQVGTSGVAASVAAVNQIYYAYLARQNLVFVHGSQVLRSFRGRSGQRMMRLQVEGKFTSSNDGDSDAGDALIMVNARDCGEGIWLALVALGSNAFQEWYFSPSRGAMYLGIT